MTTAQERCGYNPRPVLPTCGNCAAFASNRVLPGWMRDELERRKLLSMPDASGALIHYTTADEVSDRHKIETKLRCLDQGFSVKKLGSCNNWRAKE